MAILVDTHKIYSKLIEAGFEQPKTNAIVESFGMAQEDVATKGDIELMRKEIQVVEQKLMVNTWVVGTALVGVMAAFHFLG
jgi:hypothetical protein